jgi:TetR/AcrR family transcriptional regulator
MGVSQAKRPRRTALVAEQTRGLILEAAEAEFANRGFASARLEDIAERVGITRAAIIYHFRDKQALYNAVLEATFTPLADRIREAREVDAQPAQRFEGVVRAWVDYARERPTLSRLFMREVADSQGELRPDVQRHVNPMFSRVMESVEAGQASGDFRPIDPVHLVSILAGAIVWFVTHAPLLGDEPRGNDTSPESFSAYRDELIGVTRYLLDTRPPNRRAQRRSAQ